jgi:hypothetical protein
VSVISGPERLPKNPRISRYGSTLMTSTLLPEDL